MTTDQTDNNEPALEALLPCPFCGVQPLPKELLGYVVHRRPCYIIAMNREDRVAWNSRVGVDSAALTMDESFFCGHCEKRFTDKPHTTEDGYWLCDPCWKGLRSEAKGRACPRAFPCRYRDARQCAHDTMLGAECPKVCACVCHDATTATAAPAPPVQPEGQQKPSQPARDAHEIALAIAEEIAPHLDFWFRLNRDWKQQIAAKVLKHFPAAVAPVEPVPSRVISAMADVLSCAERTSTEAGNNSHFIVPGDLFEKLAQVHRELTEKPTATGDDEGDTSYGSRFGQYSTDEEAAAVDDDDD